MNKDRYIKKDVMEAYEKYADMLYRVALSHLQSEHDAQDAIHDVFEKYIRFDGNFKDEEHLKSWFIRITINNCLDMIRKRKVRNHILLDDIKDIIAHKSGLNENEQLSVMEHLAKIPDKNRSVIILHYLEGYSIEETASMLKISVSAVKMRLLRGRGFLMNEIDKED